MPPPSVPPSIFPHHARWLSPVETSSSATAPRRAHSLQICTPGMHDEADGVTGAGRAWKRAQRARVLSVAERGRKGRSWSHTPEGARQRRHQFPGCMIDGNGGLAYAPSGLMPRLDSPAAVGSQWRAGPRIFALMPHVTCCRLTNDRRRYAAGPWLSSFHPVGPEVGQHPDDGRSPGRPRGPSQTTSGQTPIRRSNRSARPRPIPDRRFAAEATGPVSMDRQPP